MKIFTVVSILAVMAVVMAACQAKAPATQPGHPSVEPNRAPAGTFQGKVYYNESKPVESYPMKEVPNQPKKP